MEIPYTELAGVLGIRRPRASSWGPVQIVDRIQRGLPISSVYSVSGQVAPGDSQFVFRIVPKASLARRKQGPKPLTADQSNRVARLASVWKVAESVWKEPEKARAFLFRPHQMLEGRKPIDVVLESELGGDLVRSILGRLQYGTAA
jgi:putative toxin-antitoxin system antitoxin component (TIGR02293 family)